jgi:hypothetical protein
MTYKYISSSGNPTVYCADRNLTSPSSGAKMSYVGEVQNQKNFSHYPNGLSSAQVAQLKYVFNHGFNRVNGKDTYDNNFGFSSLSNYKQRFYATQLAAWSVLEGGDLTSWIKGNDSHAKSDKVISIASALYSHAVKYGPGEAVNASLKLTGGGAMKLSSDKKYYESPWINLSGSGYSSAKITLVNAPGATRIILDGKEYTGSATVANGKRFYLRIPVASAANLNVTVKAAATGSNMKVGMYSAGSGQRMIFLFRENVNLNGSVKVTLAPTGALKITKVGAVNNKETGNLAGATIRVKNSAGTVVATWTTNSTNNPYTISNLPVGTYTVEETKAPSGYTKASTVKVSVKANTTITVKLVDNRVPKGNLKIQKVDISSGTAVNLSNVKITVKNSAGSVVATWTTNSTNNPYTIKDLPIGTYTVIEESAPAGYVKAKNINVTTKDGETVTVVLQNTKSPNPVTISKQDATTKAELPGAKLVLKDANGKTVDEWTSTTTPHLISNLAAGKYTLSETIAPEGYQKTTETVSFNVVSGKVTDPVVMYNKPIPEPSKIKISKQDITTKAELPGAKLVLKDALGNVVEEWTSSTTPHYITKKLAPGKYTLSETVAPAGYQKTTETVTFTVESDGGVEKAVVMYNTPIPDNSRIKISKQDITTGKELPGAKLVIKDADGKVVEEWTSTTTPHYVKDLKPGKYTLIESTAPLGYGISDEVVPFEVKADGGVEQTVVMYNSPIPVTADMNMTMIIGGLICTVALAGFSVFKLGHQNS